VFHEDLPDDSPAWSDERVLRHRDVLRRAGQRLSQGQPILVAPDGQVDIRVNLWFESDQMRDNRPLTWEKYARALQLWLSFLSACGTEWDKVDRSAQHAFKAWRMTDPRNPRRVSPGTYKGNVIAIYQFHAWAAGEYGIPNPITMREARRRRPDGAVALEPETAPSGTRDRDVKWFDPDGYRRYRDVGLLGLDVDGQDDRAFRGRNAERDGAFADLLFGTGLRLQEGGSLLTADLPPDDPGRSYYVCRVAGATAKGGYGRKFWMPRRSLLAALSYTEGERAAAVRRARRAGRYDRLFGGGAQVITRVLRARRLRVQAADAPTGETSLDVLTPAVRRTLLLQGPDGLEPAALWLNEDGMPRDPHGWHHTFAAANARLERKGFTGFSGAPHMLRHSFALRWYSVGRLLYEAKFGHLTSEELRDFRAQFGNAWDLVQMLLGHQNPQTTREIYLEPFRSLDIELLFMHTAEETVPQIMAMIFSGDRRVLSDPVKGQS
jgi:integrase